MKNPESHERKCSRYREGIGTEQVVIYGAGRARKGALPFKERFACGIDKLIIRDGEISRRQWWLRRT